MYVQDLRNSKTVFPFDSFKKGALLVKNATPMNFL